MDEKDGQVAHLAIVPISTSVTRLGARWDLCDKSGIRHKQVESRICSAFLLMTRDLERRVTMAAPGEDLHEQPFAHARIDREQFCPLSSCAGRDAGFAARAGARLLHV